MPDDKRTTRAAKRAAATETQQRFEAQYDEDPKTLVVTRKLRSDDTAVHVMNAATYDIDLGAPVYGPLTIYVELQTTTEPTIRKAVAIQEKVLVTAQAEDTSAMRDATLAQFTKHPLEIETPELLAPDAAAELLRLQELSKGVTAAKEFAYREGTAALKDDKIGKLLAKGWKAQTNPVITDDTTRGDMVALESQAADAAYAIQKLYTLHIGSLNRQDARLLKTLFEARPEEMPTLALVHETTQAHRIAAERQAAEAIEAKNAAKEQRRQESAAIAQFRNPKPVEQEVS
jgi:hypothetical protein